MVLCQLHFDLFRGEKGKNHTENVSEKLAKIIHTEL